jgi:cytidyltransferase-like protein
MLKHSVREGRGDFVYKKLDLLLLLQQTHHMNKPAAIISFDEFNKIRDKLGRIVCTSGGFDPIHPGHVSCIHDSKQYGDTLVVVVNGDNFLKVKKGRPFMDLDTRSHIVSYLKEVDYVIPFEIENDQTVSEALRKIKPHVFTKGGDRIDETSIPEWETCKKHNIQVISGVGFDKKWGSSDLLREWGEFWVLKKKAD